MDAALGDALTELVRLAAWVEQSMVARDVLALREAVAALQACLERIEASMDGFDTRLVSVVASAAVGLDDQLASDPSAWDAVAAEVAVLAAGVRHLLATVDGTTSANADMLVGHKDRVDRFRGGVMGDMLMSAQWPLGSISFDEEAITFGAGFGRRRSFARCEVGAVVVTCPGPGIVLRLTDRDGQRLGRARPTSLNRAGLQFVRIVRGKYVFWALERRGWPVVPAPKRRDR